jgi:hypothetical protein
VKRAEHATPFLREEGSSGWRQCMRRWRRRCPVGLPEEEDGRPADRAGMPVSEVEVMGQAGPEGGGREVGCNWAERGRERGGPRLGRKPEMAG